MWSRRLGPSSPAVINVSRSGSDRGHGSSPCVVAPRKPSGHSRRACLARFGTLRPRVLTPVIRSDNGPIFQSRRFRATCHDYRLRQGSLRPIRRSKNGLIERFFRSLKEDRVWL